MKTITKKLISLLLCAIMVFSTLSVGGVIDFEALAATATSGSCGRNVTWSFDSDTGELLISGTGAMNSYSSSSTAPWYSYKDKIKKVTIEDGVTSIGWYAFWNCTSLTSITIPGSITSIGDSVFRDSTGLTSITIPDSVTSIGSDAFSGCTSLTSITIPGSITSIDDSVFRGCTGLTNITIPEGVTSIGQYAFEGCTGLTNITIPDSVTSIGSDAFSGCAGLKSVTIGNSVTSIGWYAFYHCTSLTSITIPDSVTSIRQYAFDICSNLKTVYYTGNIAKWCAIDFEDHYSNPTYYASELYINGSKVEGNVEIPNGVTSIGDYAFYNCTGLTSITIPDSVTSIGSDAFSGCAGLTEIIVDSNNKNYCSIDDILFNKDKTELVCYPASKTETSYSIPNSVASIGTYAFSGCTGLTEVTIGNGVTSIGYKAFYNCTNLNTVYYTGTPTEWSKISIDSNNRKLTNSIRIYECNSDRPYCLGSCGDNVTYKFYTDGELLISGTGAMKDYTSSSDAPWYSYRKKITKVTIEDGITTIDEYAFSGCTGLTSITIPDSVTSIGEFAFQNCTGLTSITIPDSVTSIGEFAFQNCTRLTSITIPDSVTTIGNFAFEYCTGLTSITIPESVTTIGDCAFYGCSNLKTVYYTGTPTEWNKISIGSGNDYLISATKIYECNSSRPYLYSGSCGDNVTYKLRTNGELIISGTGAMTSYSSSSVPWHTYKEKIAKVTVEEGVTSVGNYAFYSCTNAESVSIPDSITSIGNYAFYGCSGLKNIYYDDIFENWEKITVGSNNDVITSALNYANYDKSKDVAWVHALDGYSIKFISNNETYFENTYAAGKKIASVDDPVRSGYTFLGWDKAIPTTMPAENVEITALWAAIDYTITFDVDGGKEIEFITQGYETKLTIPEAEKTGYTFKGWTWYDSEDTEISEAPTTMPLNGAKAVAKWQINQYTISFNTANGTKIDSITQDYNTEITTVINDPERTGYTFLGWDKAIPTTMPAENVEITALWAAIDYTITFDVAGGKEVESITQGYETKITIPETERTGYTFKGWTWYDSNGSKMSETPTTMPLNGAKAVANWQINQYTFTFDTAGGDEIDAVTLDYGTKLNSVSLKTNSSDYPESLHSGEYTTGTTYKYSYSYPGATSLTVKFSSNSSVSYYASLYVYNSSGSTVYSKTTYSNTSIAGKSFTVTGDSFTIKYYTGSYSNYYGFSIDSITANGYDLTSLVPVKYGYTFMGWDKEIPQTMPAENMTFTASWEKSPIVTFDRNGHGSSTNPVMTDYNTAAKQPADPVAEGYTFLGWFTDEKCTDAYDFSTVLTSDITLYAGWKINQYTITFDTAGGTEIASITQDYQTKIEIPENPTRTGYTFVKWDKEIPSYMPAGNVKITASWQVNTYTITYLSYNGSSFTTYSTQSKNYGTTLSAASTPTRSGYTFKGWLWPTDGENESSDNYGKMPTTMPAYNMKVYALWIPNNACSEGHTVYLVDSKVPTCTEAGHSGTTFCPTCKKQFDDGYEIPAYGHDYKDVITKNETCTEYGNTSRLCNKCGYHTDEPISPTGHSKTSQAVTTEPTCTEKGVRTFTCHCGYQWTEDIAANGHTLDKFSKVKTATCDEEGIMRYTCSVCGYYEDETIKKLEHDWVEINAKSATCTSDGCTYGKYCKRCNKVDTQSKTIQALGHSWDNVITKQMTCSEDGEYIHRCSRCGAIEAAEEGKTVETSTVISSSSYPESAHVYSNNMNKTYPFSYSGATKLALKFSSKTYFESGYDYLYIYDGNGNLYGKYTGSSLAGKSIVISGNSFSLKLTTDGSVTNYGFSFDSIYAVTLGNAKVYTVPSTGHTFKQVITKTATCQQEGEYTMKCSRCGKYETADTPVYEEKTADSSTYPETPHNYKASQTYDYQYSYPGAKDLKVTFSEKCMFETDYDFLYLYDGSGNLLGTYTGIELQGKTITVDGDSFLIKVITDDAVNNYGFSITKIVANADVSVKKYTSAKSAHKYKETVAKAATTTEEGKLTKICENCGYSTTETIPKTIYAVGEIISYGSYPQSKVTDETTLNALDAMNKTWISYNYYSGNGSSDNGKMSASNFMKYTDVTYNGNKYRGVTFETYRPTNTGYVTAQLGNYSNQDENNYYKNKVYWFKYDPIQWRILDPTSGLVVCETVIDAQPYNSYISGSYSRNSSYANNYEKSSIREWLNDDFYNTAFSSTQKANVLTTSVKSPSSSTLRGDCVSSSYDSGKTSDKVFLLSYDEIINSDYGFSTSLDASSGRTVYKGTDYARCQGLGNSSGYCEWFLRTAGTSAKSVQIVSSDGRVTYSQSLSTTLRGVRPALRLSHISATGGASSSGTKYNVTYKVNNVVVATAKFMAGAPVVSIFVDEKAGCEFSGWSEPEEMPNGDIVLTGEYLPVYTATFKADGKTVDTAEYTTATTTIIEPTVPEKTGYIGQWESYSFTAGGITINAVYTLDGDHTHSYTSTITKAATCTATGVKTFKCTCGDSYTETIKALGHSFTTYVYNNDATTEKDGTETATCDRCTATNTRTKSGSKLQPAHIHSFTKKVTAPTCTEQGYTTYTCSCGFSYKDDYQPATNHVDSNNDGYCDNCSAPMKSNPVNPNANAKINVAGSRTVDYRSKVTITAKASGVDSSYRLAIYVGNNRVATGSNTEVSYSVGETKGDVNYTVKVVDANGNIAKDASGNEISKAGGKISCNSGFFKKLVAFFKGLFGSLPNVTVQP